MEGRTKKQGQTLFWSPNPFSFVWKRPQGGLRDIPYAIELAEVVAIDGPAEVGHDALVVQDWASTGEGCTGGRIGPESRLMGQSIQRILEGGIRLRPVCLP